MKYLVYLINLEIKKSPLLRYPAILLTLWLLPFNLWPQKGAFALELSAGITIYQGDLSKEGFGTARGKNEIFGLKTTYELSDYWAIEAGFHRGELGAADTFYREDNFLRQRQFEFQTSFQDASLQAHFSPLGQLRLQPYAAVGVGLIFFKPQAFMLNNIHLDLFDLIKKDIQATLPTKAWYIPVEFGVAYKLNERISLTTGLQLNFTLTDYLDGVSWAGNPNDKDRYSQLYLGVKFRFNGIKDIDGDGIPDAEDECPFKPGLRATHGCPDADGDNIRDSEDRCPYAAGEKGMSGCPDTDKDGTADPYDRCPAQAGPPEALGCPAIDSDRDGIEDHLDECPLKAGPPERNGCPAIDTDLDGILDEDDQCPVLFGLAIFDGCPDTDGDGIEDNKDACPSLFGLFTKNGCPEFINTENEARMLSKQELRFGINDSSITNYMLLDKIVNFLIKNPSYHLSIRGHADPLGSDEAVDYISQLRAEKVKQYISKSIAPTRLRSEALGIQEAVILKPGLLNQSKNRRVEFILSE